ncbi:MAG: hypothetical protein Q4F95_11800, partial [Oscillospiraceae bacterium]|nr:hypothetical protein [Oscillospiraceae bacterium]
SDNGSAQPQNPGPQFTQYGSSQAQNQGSQFTQYGSTQAQGISEQNNTVNMKSQKSVTDTGLGDIAPPQLEDEPPVNQRYVPRYADPDLEAAKKQSVDRAIKGSISAANESLDKEKSLAAYRDFMREKESDMAKKGAKAVVFLMIGTLISGLITFLYTSFAMKSGCPDVLGSINSFYIAVGIAQLLAGGLMLAPTKSTQKASSTILTLATIVHVIPGVIVMLNKQNIKIAVILYLAVLILNIAVCFTLGSNENIKKHYNGHEID